MMHRVFDYKDHFVHFFGVAIINLITFCQPCYIDEIQRMQAHLALYAKRRLNLVQLEVRDTPFETPVTTIFSPLPDRLSLRTSLFSSFGVDITLKLGYQRLASIGV